MSEWSRRSNGGSAWGRRRLAGRIECSFSTAVRTIISVKREEGEVGEDQSTSRGDDATWERTGSTSSADWLA